MRRLHPICHLGLGIHPLAHAGQTPAAPCPPTHSPCCSLTGKEVAPRRPANSNGSSGSSAARSSEGGTGSAPAGSSGGGSGSGGGQGAASHSSSNGSSSNSGASGNLLVPNNPESRYREVGASLRHSPMLGLADFWAACLRCCPAQPILRSLGSLRCLRLGPQSLLPLLPSAARLLQVLVVPLGMRPLFPGGIMPVTVQNNKLIKELVEIRRQG